MAKKRTPQEKKTKSYERDRRNAYGEHSKGSRKAIPLQKKSATRSNRRAAAQPLRQPAETVDELTGLEEAVEGLRPGQWKKVPDVPLKDFLEVQAARRRNREGRKGPKKRPATE